MGSPRDDAMEVRAHGWRALTALHAHVDAALERRLQAGHAMSVVEWTVLDALSRQDGFHLRMAQLARAAALSPSAATRLVTRLEDRGLLRRTICQDDRRGIYSELTDRGRAVFDAARADHDEALAAALGDAAAIPELQPLVEALEDLVRPTAARVD